MPHRAIRLAAIAWLHETFGFEERLRRCEAVLGLLLEALADDRLKVAPEP